MPIGLIDASRGGTTVEAWAARQTLAKTPQAAPLLKAWDETTAAFDPQQDLEARIQRWEKDTERRKAKGLKPNPKPHDLRPGPAFDRNNPGASFNGMIAPFAGFAIKGAIFNQGFNNALGDAPSTTNNCRSG